MTYRAISDYGLIGDMHSAALVGLDGSIDWLCFPRFDSPSVFASILDDAHGGRFRLAPDGGCTAEQRYLADTNVLVTTFRTSTGAVETIDFMPLRSDKARSDHLVVRVVRGLDGSVAMECVFGPRLDYARSHTRLSVVDGGVVAKHESGRLALASPVELNVRGDVAYGQFHVQKGDEVAFAFQWDVERPPDTTGWRRQLDVTTEDWQHVLDGIGYAGRWGPELRRSVLALHLLLYYPTGALVAASTTSLPERVGGERNWDYRYCWIRDSAFILDAFDRLGHVGETARFATWLAGFCESCGERLQTLYGVEYGEELPERTLDHLEGYRRSRPVRLGNAASTQLQLDIFGEFMIAMSTFHRAGGQISEEMWATITSFATAVIGNWDRRDRGIWEVRGERRHFVHSKVMCWLALDRAISLAEDTGRVADIATWRSVSASIRDDVLRRGWNERLESFVQYYGADHSDASLLMLPMVGFIDADDERMRSTVARIRAELETDGLLHRYQAQRTDDGLAGGEGAFLMCTLWLAGYYAFVGEVEEARAILERVLACGNHVGLFSEMFDPATNEALGNFPQAFTHVSLIHTIRNVHMAIEQHGSPSAREIRVGEPAGSS
jgi:GH15 family glucan-1,4-alpha-glucosidase